jgi:hypothetical protein
MFLDNKELTSSTSVVFGLTGGAAIVGRGAEIKMS